jgi:hypothetical protein
MVSDFVAFLIALTPHWWVFLTSGPVAIDRVLRNHSVGYAAWADGRWDAHARAKIFRRLAVLGFFIGCFLAFRDEHRRLLDTQQVADQAAGKREREYPANYVRATADLREKLDGVLATHPGSWIWVGYVDNPSSVKLALGFATSFKHPGLQIQAVPYPEDDVNGEGLTLYVHDAINLNSEEKKVVDAFRASGFVNLKLNQLSKDPEYADEIFGVYVSYPPR